MYLNYQEQVLVGSVLGGSSLVKPPGGKNYYLSMRSKDSLWLEYKMAEMPDYYPNPKVHQYGLTYRANSTCLEYLTDIHDHLYEGNRRTISMQVLDVLKDVAIAIWFLDGGGKTGRYKKNAYINTTKFGEKGTETILQYFNEVSMPCNVNHDGTRLKILFSVEGTTALFKVIAHRFPEFMHYRLGNHSITKS